MVFFFPFLNLFQLSSNFLPLCITQSPLLFSENRNISDTQKETSTLAEAAKHLGSCLELASRNRFYCRVNVVTAALCPWPSKGHLSAIKFRLQLVYLHYFLKTSAVLYHRRRIFKLRRYISKLFLTLPTDQNTEFHGQFISITCTRDLWWGNVRCLPSILRCPSMALHLSTSHHDLHATLYTKEMQNR